MMIHCCSSLGFILFSLLALTSTCTNVSAYTVIDDRNDGVWWDITYQLDDSYNEKGQSRIFHVAYPSARLYKNAPLLIHFHGGFGDGKNAAESTGFTDIAGREGFLTVYGVGVWRRWSAGACCGACATNVLDEPCYIDDVHYVQGVLDVLMEERLINSESFVFLSGHSNGAYMTYRLACELRDSIHGIAPVAGNPGYCNGDECLYNCNDDSKLCYNSSKEQCSESSWRMSLPLYYTCNVASPLPVITFQGYKDEHILIDGGMCITDDCHGNMTVIPYSFEVKENARVNSCDMDHAAVRSFYNISETNVDDVSECWTYQGCAGNTTYCIQHIGEHAWPGSTYSECDTNSPDYDPQDCADKIATSGPEIKSMHASVVIVDYFRSVMAGETSNASEDLDLLGLTHNEEAVLWSVVIVVVGALCGIIIGYKYKRSIGRNSDNVHLL